MISDDNSRSEGPASSIFLSPVDEKEIVKTVHLLKNKTSTDYGPRL